KKVFSRKTGSVQVAAAPSIDVRKNFRRVCRVGFIIVRPIEIAVCSSSNGQGPASIDRFCPVLAPRGIAQKFQFLSRTPDFGKAARSNDRQVRAVHRAARLARACERRSALVGFAWPMAPDE